MKIYRISKNREIALKRCWDFVGFVHKKDKKTLDFPFIL